MKGSIFYQRDRGRWAVVWYFGGRPHTITRYRGQLMPCTHFQMARQGSPKLDDKGFPVPDRDRCYGYELARKLLAMLQGRWEQHERGECQFRIEEFVGQGWTDVIEFYEEEWLPVLADKKKRSPATVNGYRSYLNCHLKPFLEKHPIRLHEIDLPWLYKLMGSLKHAKTRKPLSGKSKLNIMMAFHKMMDYAYRSNRIPEIPPFPEYEDYGIAEPDFEWLWESDQMKVIEAIALHHRPIFLWLKYHYRREGEACALHKVDYDPINKAFKVRRSISGRRLTNRTKTGAIHYIPCADEFVETADRLLNENPESPFLFVNPNARRDGKRYTIESLNIIWKKACKTGGIPPIKLYHGTKHSSCTQFINERNGSDDELQMLTDHARRDSITKYRKINLDRKRLLMRKGRVLDLQQIIRDRTADRQNTP